MRTRKNNQRGAALIETAITIPMLLLVSVAIFEFGRAYQTWQVLTNAAREGTRIAVIAGNSDDAVRTAVQNYMDIGGLPLARDASVTINIERGVPLGVGTATASRVTVAYPFDFMVLGPIMALVNPGGDGGGPLTMNAVAFMRNEG